VAKYERIRTENGIQYADYPEEYLRGGQSFELKVSQGLIPKHSFVAKFGENSDIDTGTVPEDVWEYGGAYTYDATGTAPIVSVVSDNAGDTESFGIQGLDINGNLVTQTVTLNGTTRVALTTPLWRVFRMSNQSATDIVGTVYCYVGTGGVPSATNVRAIVTSTNQTLMALYTIPLGKVGFLKNVVLSGSGTKTAGYAQCSYAIRNVGKVFKIKRRLDISFSGSSSFLDLRFFPGPIPALSDIRVRVEDVSANDTGISSTFDILLVDEDVFSDEYLSSIGQPSEMP
jgi:hypothetical protein